MPIAFNYGMQFFIDADNNPNTGYVGTGGEFNIGADYLVQGYSDPSGGGGILIYPFNGVTQTTWGWDAVNGDWPEYAWDAGELEIRIPKWQLKRSANVSSNLHIPTSKHYQAVY